MFDKREFRDAMASFTTGVTIVTAVGPDGELLGLPMFNFRAGCRNRIDGRKVS